MRNILAARNLDVLRRFVRGRVLLGLDFDGTLAPIVRRREAARMRASTTRLLEEAARLYPCAIISGRARADVAARLEGAPVAAVVGNHGLEPWFANERTVHTVAAWRRQLERELDGVDIEDKRYSLAVHYRRARSDRARVLRATTALPDARLIGGKMVVNVLPEGAFGKGGALERLRAELGCERAIYVGDDDTDEDVFARRSPRLLGIRVGKSARSRARWFVATQKDVDALLRILVGSSPEIDRSA